jgi:hypothetical protein
MIAISYMLLYDEIFEVNIFETEEEAKIWIIDEIFSMLYDLGYIPGLPEITEQKEDVVKNYLLNSDLNRVIDIMTNDPGIRIKYETKP